MDYDLIVAGGGIASARPWRHEWPQMVRAFCCWNVICSSTIESEASPFSPGVLPRFVSWGSRTYCSGPSELRWFQQIVNGRVAMRRDTSRPR